LCQRLQRSLGIFPADTRVRDADSVLEAGLALRRHLLVALVDVALDHDTHDGGLALGNLLGEHSGNLGLVLVVLL